MGTRWIPDEASVALLDQSGEPFDHARYRRAWTDETDWRDVSFGARAGDGTQAAIALLSRRGAAHSLPLGYGGVVASRALGAGEVSSFLCAARRAARAHDLRALSVPIDPPLSQLHVGGNVVAWTSVVFLDSSGPARFTRKGRLKISRAQSAGGSARPPSNDPEPFLRLYERAARDWHAQYPADVLRHLADTGLLTLYDVELDGNVASSMAAIRGERHWLYWLGAQNDAGRAAELGYLAAAALVQDAHAAGARAVNLGASTGLPGVALFKRRFGTVDVPVLEHRSAPTLGRVMHSAVDVGRRGARVARSVRRASEASRGR